MFPKHPLYQTFCETLMANYELSANEVEHILIHAYLVPDPEMLANALAEDIIEGLRLSTEPSIYLIDNQSYDAFTILPKQPTTLDKIENVGIALVPSTTAAFLKSLTAFLKEEQENTLIGVDLPPVSDYDKFHFERYETYETFIDGLKLLSPEDFSKTYVTIGGPFSDDYQTINRAHNMKSLHRKNLAYFKALGVDDIEDHYQTELYRWHSIPISDTEEFWYYIEEQLVD